MFQNVLKYMYNFVLFILLIKTSLQVTANVEHVLKCNANFSNEFSNAFRFHLPYADMSFQTDYKVLLRQDIPRNLIFVFHGNEMYQLLVSRESKRIIYLGHLHGIIHAEHVLDVELIFLRNYWLLVVAAAEHVEIYQLPLDKIQAQRSLQAVPYLLFEPIQQIMLHGKYQRMFLTMPTQHRIMLIIALNENQQTSKISTFHWSNTYFDAIEEFDLPAIHFIDFIGNNTKYIVAAKTAKQQQQLVLGIYQLDAKSLHLKLSQTLNLNSESLHAGTFQGRSFIISCTQTQHKCYILRRRLLQDAQQFTVFKTHAWKDLNFQQFRAGNNFMLGVQQQELRLFANPRLECYHSFVTNNTAGHHPQLLIHVNAEDVNFVLLQYNYAHQTLIRFVEVEMADKAQLQQINQAEELDVGTRQEHLFENTIARLRSLLLRRRAVMEVFQQIDAVTSNKLSHVTSTEPMHIEHGNIGVVRVEDDTLLSPAQLMQRIKQMHYNVQNQRHRRALEQNATASVLNVRKLKVKNLIYNENILNNFHLINNTQSSAILSIRENITTNSLNTPELLTRQNYKPLTPETLISNENSTNLLKVTNLNVQSINNISWAEFYANVFLKNRDAKIRGRLIFQSDLKIKHLETPLLNGLLVQQLFNLKQPQIILSDISISAFFVSDLQANKINGLNFAEDIVFSGTNVTLQTPIKMHKLSIAGDIVFPEHVNLKRSNDIRQLQQQYNGEVIINGSLTLLDVATESSQTEIWMNTLPLMLPLYRKIYLLNDTRQNFEYPVTFGNAKISAAALESEFLNDHPIQQHLLSTTKPTTAAPIFLMFKSAEIAGNLINSNLSASQLMQLNNSVARIGEITNITGFKQFTDTLIIENLLTLQLNDIPVSDLVRKQDLSKKFAFNAAKKFKNIMATGKVFVEHELNATLLNNIKLQELLNYDYYVESLTLPHSLQAASVVFHKINDISFDDVFTKFHIRGNELVLQKTLIIEGNATFAQELYLQEINNINWTQYQQTLVQRHATQLIQGQKEFMNAVIITNALKTAAINNMQLQQLFAHMLTKSSRQEITAVYTFGNLHVKNILVETINKMSSKALIDTHAAHTIIDADLIVPSLTVHGNASAAFEHKFEFNILARQLQQLLDLNWRRIVVHGNVSWTENSADPDLHDKLLYLYKHAVRHSADQIITGNIQLVNPIIHNMHTKSALLKNIDLHDIFSDCLLRNHSAMQTIIAAKSFINMQQLRHMEAQHLLNVQNLNGIDIARFDAALYRKSNAANIKAALQFMKTPYIENLNVFGRINGIEPAVIYQLGQTLPALIMHDLTALESLEIEQFNDMNLNLFLNTRIKKQASTMQIFGHLSFENLIVSKKLNALQINNINLNNLVFKNSTFMQTISAAKQILGKLVLEGPVHVMRLNDKDLMQSYLLSLATDKNVHFDTLTVDAANFQSGLIMLQQATARQPAAKTAEQRCSTHNFDQLSRTLQRLETNVQHASDLRYLDYDKQLKILWQTPNETILQTKFYELSCALHNCERQLLRAQLDKSKENLYLSNISSNYFMANAGNVAVKVENDCAHIICNIEIKYKNKTLNYKIKEYALNLKLMQFDNNNSIFIMLQVNNMLDAEHVVRFYKYDKQMQILQDWQNITTTSRVTVYAEINNNNWLFVANNTALIIYAFDLQQEKFQIKQMIAGDYDIIRSINLQNATAQLMLSCRLCKHIQLYIYDPAMQRFKILQLIQLKTQVQDVLAFNLNNKRWYLLVLSKQQMQLHYQLYKYAYIEGWVHVLQAYFADVQMALPLLEENMQVAADKQLLLLCNAHAACNMVKAFV